jgi:zinc protease
MRLIVLAGSVDERPEELGIAHFIEHMAFNGTRNFKSGALRAFFQDLGMDMGSDINAATTFDSTIYMLEYRENAEDLLRQGLLLFRDFAEGISFEEKEIEKEKGVILSEMRGRGGLTERAQMASLGTIYAGMKFTDRNPIGTTRTINSFNRNDFLRYYRRMYRSDQMILVVTGDFVKEELLADIELRFKDMPAPTVPLPAREIGRLDRRSQLRASVFRITDVGSVEIRAASVRERSATRRGTRDGLRDQLYRNLAMTLLSARMGKYLQRVSGGWAQYIELMDIETAVAAVTVGGYDWEHGLVSLDELIRFTAEKGFRQRKFEQLKKRVLADIGTSREQLPTLDPSLLANELSGSIAENWVYLGYDRNLEMQAEFVRDLDLKRLNRIFKDAWDLNSMAFYISGEIESETDAKEILAALRSGRQRREYYLLVPSFLQPETYDGIEFEKKDLGAPGEVVATETIPEFNAHLMRFDNEVRLNFIENHREPGIVRAIVRVGGGLFDMPSNRMALREFGLGTVLKSGTEHYRAEVIGAIVSDTLHSFSFDVSDHDAFSFRGVFNREDIDTFFGVVADYLYKPKFLNYVHKDSRSAAAASRMGSASGISGGLQVLDNFLFEGDARFARGDLIDYVSLSVSDVQEWMEEPLLRGYVEVSIIGDIKRESAVESVAGTLGALQKRNRGKLHPDPRWPVEVSGSAGVERIEFVGEDHLALVLGTWPIQSRVALREQLCLTALTTILEGRLTQLLREDLGKTYHPSAKLTPYDEYPDFAFIRATIDCAPTDADEIGRAVLNLSKELSREGISEEELNGVLRPLGNKLNLALTKNDFLIENLLKRAQENPDTVEAIKAIRDGAIATLGIDEVNAFAQTVFSRRNLRIAVIVPKPFIGIYQTE